MSLSISEAARRWGVSRETIYEKEQAGKLSFATTEPPTVEPAEMVRVFGISLEHADLIARLRASLDRRNAEARSVGWFESLLGRYLKFWTTGFSGWFVGGYIFRFFIAVCVLLITCIGYLGVLLADYIALSLRFASETKTWMELGGFFLVLLVGFWIFDLLWRRFDRLD